MSARRQVILDFYHANPSFPFLSPRSCLKTWPRQWHFHPQRKQWKHLRLSILNCFIRTPPTELSLHLEVSVWYHWSQDVRECPVVSYNNLAAICLQLVLQTVCGPRTSSSQSGDFGCVSKTRCPKVWWVLTRITPFKGMRHTHLRTARARIISNC